MSRYNGSNSGSNGGSNDYDDITLKLQKYAAVRVTDPRVNAFNSDYGDRLVIGFEDLDVLDGVVFQREDKPGTWKVFGASKWFNMNPEDGLIYESYDPDADEYQGQMSAQDILEHPRVLGFSETFGGDDYFYNPIGAVIEEGDDIALNDDIIGTEQGLSESQVEQAREETIIPVGEVSMLLSNKSWVRTMGKKLTTDGDAFIADDDQAYEKYNWYTNDDPELRPELDGREMELWITEEQNPGDSDGTHTTPNLMDTKTGNFVTIDNGVEESSDGGDTQEAATDGGTATQSGGSTSTDTAASSSGGDQLPTDSESDASGLPDDVPDVLDDLLDYFARTQGEATAEELREFAADEVDDPDAVDWEAAADAVATRA